VERRRYALAVLVILGVLAAYALTFWLRLTKAL
jgi:type II secretory pathway pseudopilin PulG